MVLMFLLALYYLSNEVTTLDHIRPLLLLPFHFPRYFSTTSPSWRPLLTKTSRSSAKALVSWWQSSHLSVYGTDSPFMGRSVRVRLVRHLKQLDVCISSKNLLSVPIANIFRLKNHNFCNNLSRKHEFYEKPRKLYEIHFKIFPASLVLFY
jgi:hypothetical protein